MEAFEDHFSYISSFFLLKKIIVIIFFEIIKNKIFVSFSFVTFFSFYFHFSHFKGTKHNLAIY